MTSKGDGDLWLEAVAKYVRQTGRTLKPDTTLFKVQSLDDLGKAVENETKRLSKFREDHGKVYVALRKCIKPLECMTDLAQTVVSVTPYAPVAVVFGAAKHLLEACDTVSNGYDSVQELFRSITEITERIQGAKTDKMDDLLRRKLTDILSFILEIIGKSEEMIEKGRVKQWARAVFVKEDVIKNDIARLDKYVQSELGLVIHLVLRRQGEIQDSVETIKTSTAEGFRTVKDMLTNQQNNEIQTKRNETEEKEMKEMLSKLSAAADPIVRREHDEIMDKLTKGTGDWLQKEPLFAAWREEKAPLLWIFGRPGTGKTYLAAKTVDILQRLYPRQPDGTNLTSVSYFYIKGGDPNLVDLVQLLKVVALQIAEVNDRFKKFATSVVQKPDSLISARQTWESLFLKFFTETEVSTVATSLSFVVIDGLDEAPDRERTQFIEMLAKLVERTDSSKRCRIQIAVFARPEIQGVAGFERVSFQSQKKVIEITSNRNKEDIEAFIKSKVRSVKALRDLDSLKPGTKKTKRDFQRLLKRIMTTVKEKSNGMFKWAELVFDTISILDTPEEVNVALDDAPLKLKEMIHLTLRRLEVQKPSSVVYLRQSLMLAFCALRPFTIAEIWMILYLTIYEQCNGIENDMQAQYGSIFELSPETRSEGSVVEKDEPEKRERPSLFDDSSDHDETDESLDDDDDDNTVSDGSDSIEDEQSALHSDNFGFSGSYGHYQDLDPRWSSITVNFSHASIRDYLAEEANPVKRQWYDCSLIIADPNVAHLHLAFVCVRIFTGDVAESYNVPSLKDYAKRHYMKHLAHVDFAAIDASNHMEEMLKIAELFYDATLLLKSCEDDQDDLFAAGYERTDYFIESWMTTSNYSCKVRQLLGRVTDHLTGERKQWADRALRSARALFEPLALECQRIWLTKTGWDDSAYLDKSQRLVGILFAYHSLTDDGDNPEKYLVDFDTGAYLNYLPLDTLKALAHSSNLVHSEHWYTGLAWIMKDCGYFDDAIEHFEAALTPDSPAWVAMEGLGICYGVCGEYLKAIDWMQKAIQSVETIPGLEDIAFYMRPSIAAWHQQLGNASQAADSAREAYSASKEFHYGTGTASDDKILQATEQYIEALLEMESYDELGDLILELDSQPTCRQLSLLEVLLQAQYPSPYQGGLHDKLGLILSIKKEDDDLKEIIQAAVIQSGTRHENEADVGITKGNPFHSNWLRLQAARWNLRWSETPESSMSILETLIEDIHNSDPILQQRQVWLRDRAAGLLSQIYFEAALEEDGPASDRPLTKHEMTFPESISKLSALATHQQGGDYHYRVAYSAMLYGIWLREKGANEDVWRACFLPSIKHAIFLLTDDDPLNDQDAYCELGTALLLAGDETAASIALGISLKPLADYHDRMASLKFDDDISDSNASSEKADSIAGALVRSYSPRAQVLDIDVTINADCSEGNNDGASQADFNEKLAGFELRFTCDGPCGRPSRNYKELHFCMFCDDICFCESCVKLLKDEKMPFRICSVEHPLVQVIPFTPEAKDMVDSLVARDFTPQTQWLQELSTTWGL